MTRIICVASGKGGAGKTTTVSNLAAALAEFNRSVIAVDANLTTSNLGLHLGIPLYPTTLQDVLNRKAHIRDAVYFHESGFRVVPADISMSKVMSPDSSLLIDALYRLMGEADFILIDCAAGLGREASEAIKASDEMIVVTNPEIPALTDGLKVIQMAESMGTNTLGVVVNRIKNSPHEFPVNEIEGFLGTRIIGEVNEHPAVMRSLSKRQPVVSSEPKSLPARQFRKIAANLIGEEYEVKPSLISRLFRWMG